MKQYHSRKTSLHVLILFTQWQVSKMKLPFIKTVLRILRESTTSPRFYKEAYKNYTELPHQYLIRSNVNQCKFLIHENLIKMILCLHFNMLLKWHHIIFHILFLETCKSYGLCQTGLSIEKKRKIFWKHCALAYVKECSALKKSFGMSYINWKRIMTT